MDRDQVKIITVQSEKEREVVNSVGGVLSILSPGTLEPTIYVTSEGRQHSSYHFALERGYVFYELDAHKNIEVIPCVYNILKETDSLEQFFYKMHLYIRSLDTESLTEYVHKAFGPEKIEEEVKIDRIAASRSDAYSVSSLLNLLETSYRDETELTDNPMERGLRRLLSCRIENLRVVSGNMWREYFLTKDGGNVSATEPG